MVNSCCPGAWELEWGKACQFPGWLDAAQMQDCLLPVAPIISYLPVSFSVFVLFNIMWLVGLICNGMMAARQRLN